MTDQSAAIITNAAVKAVHVATNFERQVSTSSEGSYTITQLPVGSYVVIVTVQNFQTTTIENIEVTAGSIVRVDAPLQSRIAGRVTVNAEGGKYNGPSRSQRDQQQFIQELQAGGRRQLLRR